MSFRTFRIKRAALIDLNSLLYAQRRCRYFPVSWLKLTLATSTWNCFDRLLISGCIKGKRKKLWSVGAEEQSPALQIPGTHLINFLQVCPQLFLKGVKRRERECFQVREGAQKLRVLACVDPLQLLLQLLHLQLQCFPLLPGQFTLHVSCVGAIICFLCLLFPSITSLRVPTKRVKEAVWKLSQPPREDPRQKKKKSISIYSSPGVCSVQSALFPNSETSLELCFKALPFQIPHLLGSWF